MNEFADRQARAGLPIGVFDSGAGGLTALSPLIKSMPREDTVYFGDVARTPYGDKDPNDIRRFALEALDFFSAAPVKALLVACNSASAAAISALEHSATFPVFDVICPGARAAVIYTHNDRVGVMGTNATINSGLYRHTVKAINPAVQVYQVACPKLAPMIEENRASEEDYRRVIAEYLGQIPLATIDTLILGCTHYPLIKNIIQEVVGPKVRLVDSGEEAAKEVDAQVRSLQLTNRRATPGTHRFVVSARPEEFRLQAERFMGRPIAEVECAVLGPSTAA